MDMNAHIEYSSMMTHIDHFVICKVALVIVITRFIFFCAQRFLNNYSLSIENESSSSCTESSSSAEFFLEMARENLMLTTFGDIEDKLNHVGSCKKSCAVCLETFTRKSEVSELCNCGHVFHRGCLDRWLRYDIARMTCPLCRTCLINNMSSQVPTLVLQQQQPSWVVERILYMFGDDYNTCSSL